MRSVYIASQYSNGGKITNRNELLTNVKIQMDYSDILMKYGFLVHTPLLSHFQDSYKKQSYEIWIRQCLNNIIKYDNVLRIKGKSQGANKEIKLAKSKNIPIYNSIRALLDAQSDYHDDEIKEMLNKKEYKEFCKWIYGQSCPLSDTGEILIYAEDLHRFLAMIRLGRQTYFD